jgi:beta-galactosidase
MTKIVVNYVVIFILFYSVTLKANGEGYPAPLQKNAAPFIGAQVFIEPGQSPEDIDNWFRQLKEHNMLFCRIRMFELYMRDENYNWDFSLFDEAFQAAERYGIHIYATLFPYTEKTDIGGFKFPRDQAHLNSIAVFIEKAVLHFNRFKSLYGWVLINEPGTGGQVPDNEFASLKYKEWLEINPQKEYTEKGYPVLVDFARENFLLDYNTWFLNWIALEIKKYDQSHDVHVNNHAIFSNVAEYNFPEWRKFLTSLGGSAHPSWHFSYFTREKYAVAMSANCEINYSGAGNLPWLMTELQGGNNTYSGGNPMCPTKEEIAQWLWIITATESKGTIFWTLNPRSSGIEAGEWALLDFQDNPTDRMEEAAKVAKTISNNNNLFAHAKKVNSKINLIYARESLWAESKMVLYANNYEGRNKGAVMKSVLGYFEALSEMGITPNLKAFDEFNFSENEYSGETIILTHQIAIPGNYADSLELFVSRGGILLVDGLTAFFDENMHNTMKTGFDYQDLFGGQVSEFKLIDNIFNVEIEDEMIPVHLWKGFLKPGNGLPLFDVEKKIVGLRNSYGKGKVLWIPSLLGLGGRIKGDYKPLQNLLLKELVSVLKNNPVQFAEPHKLVLMKTLQSGDSLITVLVNKDEQVHDVNLEFNSTYENSKEIYPEIKKIDGKIVRLLPEETKVIIWN